MSPARATGHTHDGAPAVHIPIGRAQAGKSGHQKDSCRIRDALGDLLALGGGRDQLHFIPEPLHRSAAHEYAALQGISGLAIQPPRHGGQQAVAAFYRRVARVHQHEAAGAIGVFHHARRKAALSEQRRVLIARHSRHGNGPSENFRAQVAHHMGAVHHLGQHGPGDVQHGEQLVIPCLGVDVEQHGASGVGSVGHVGPPLHQIPAKEAVHRTEAQLAPLRPLMEVQRVQQISQLGAAEIRVRHQPGLLADHVSLALPHQPLHVGSGAAALPHDGVVDAAARVLFPQKGGLPLVGDADGGDVLHLHAAHFHGLLQRGDLGVQDVLGVVLHPARLGIVLLELDGVGSQYPPGFVKDDSPAGRGSLIQGDENVPAHVFSSL